MPSRHYSLQIQQEQVAQRRVPLLFWIPLQMLSLFWSGVRVGELVLPLFPMFPQSQVNSLWIKCLGSSSILFDLPVMGTQLWLLSQRCCKAGRMGQEALPTATKLSIPHRVDLESRFSHAGIMASAVPFSAVVPSLYALGMDIAGQKSHTSLCTCREVE